MNWGFRKCLLPHRGDRTCASITIPVKKGNKSTILAFRSGNFSSVCFWKLNLGPRATRFDWFRVAFLWSLTQQVWSLRSLWTCDLKNKRESSDQRSAGLNFDWFCCLFCDIVPAPALRPYVSTGSEAGRRCPASGRTAALPSLPPDLWTRWSKAERGPQRPWPCSPGPAATCAPAQTRLRNQDRLGSEAGWPTQKTEPSIWPWGFVVENTFWRSFFSIFGRLLM